MYKYSKRNVCLTKGVIAKFTMTWLYARIPYIFVRPEEKGCKVLYYREIGCKVLSCKVLHFE